jgi:DtxR family Mn-dependent transcriptional regulator
MILTSSTAPSLMSEPLEDYLETIYLLVQEHGFARVKDIAKARDVKAATVSIALRKLDEAQLVNYVRREYIGLTTKGEEAARRILTRHRLLTRFFEEVLGMPAHAAGEQACAMEHVLTDEAMDRMVRFFEFLGTCPSVLKAFGQCPAGARPGDEHSCGISSPECARCSLNPKESSMSIASMKPGQSAIVTQITATGALRQRLLDMGILPETAIDVERSGPGGHPLWIRCQGARLALRRAEASNILVRRPA